MGLFGFGSSKQHHSSDDGEDEADNAWIAQLAARRDRDRQQDPSDFGAGCADARFTIDDMRRHYDQYGYSSFQEAAQTAGQHAYSQYQSAKELVEQGYEELRGQMEFYRGEKSVYD